MTSEIHPGVGLLTSLFILVAPAKAVVGRHSPTDILAGVSLVGQRVARQQLAADSVRQPCQKSRIMASIVGFHHIARLCEEVTGDAFHVHLIPKWELIVGLQVL